MTHASTRSMYAFALLAALGASACNKRNHDGHRHASAHDDGSAERALEEMTVDALSAMIDRGETVAVFDANGRPRYEEGHIPGATHVGHDTIGAEILPPDRATPLVFYCYNER